MELQRNRFAHSPRFVRLVQAARENPALDVQLVPVSIFVGRAPEQPAGAPAAPVAAPGIPLESLISVSNAPFNAEIFSQEMGAIRRDITPTGQRTGTTTPLAS